VKIPTALASAALIDPDFWSNRSVLITGHTGFKGAWLSLWLQSLGARVTGLAPAPPTSPSLYALARIGDHMAGELPIDIRDGASVREAVAAASPDIVLHLAAQPMVRLSLRAPALTFEVNVLGTINVLEAVRLAGESVQAVVVVTSDKCYSNPSGYTCAPGDSSGVADPSAAAAAAAAAAGGPHRFVETDPLGGHDPYSSSKACAELVTAAYRESFFSPAAAAAAAGGDDDGGDDDGDDDDGGIPLGLAGTAARVASARAGNVIGGGDFGEDRLVPDILRAYDAGLPVQVRNPDAIRPWQHVLNPLSGYLALAQSLCGPNPDGAARAFNFGPRSQDARTVLEIVRRLDSLLDGALGYELDGTIHPPEASRLELDSSAAEQRFGWRPCWDLDEALARVAGWHEAHRRDEDMRSTSLEQIAAFR
jgi:CDP-glucose 4,6-dehydratase